MTQRHGEILCRIHLTSQRKFVLNQLPLQLMIGCMCDVHQWSRPGCMCKDATAAVILDQSQVRN